MYKTGEKLLVMLILTTCLATTLVFHLQEKIFMEEDELLNLDLPWKNTPYTKIRMSLAACDQELTFFGPPDNRKGLGSWL